MSRIIRPGTAENVLIDGRIRHTIVRTVDDQDNINVRVGGASASATFNADRAASTKTRAFLFEEE